MNNATRPGLLSRLWFQAMLGTRYLGIDASTKSFGTEVQLDTIQRIYVINLDREPDRWRQMRRELENLHDRSGRPLTTVSRRFSAVDARHYKAPPGPDVIQPHYSLADQLFVQPNPQLNEVTNAQSREIEMTPQEIAVALSHVEVWQLIAKSDCPFTLVLEDDVFFRRGFARNFDAAWEDLMQQSGRETGVDMVYLSYKEADEEAPRKQFSDFLFVPSTGLWQLSGYILSKAGAQKLLNLLPVRGPVDLWLNHQFNQLDVFATRRSIIDQRRDFPSTNSYSILPILSELGVITREKPLLVERKAMPGPVFAFGKSGSGLTALSMALSMLGYRCCSNISALPPDEHSDLFGKKRDRVFDAYANIGTLRTLELSKLAELYPQARFVLTVDDGERHRKSTDGTTRGTSKSEPLRTDEYWPTDLYALLHEEMPKSVLVLPNRYRDKWELLCGFLGCEYPAYAFPECDDQVQRPLLLEAGENSSGRRFEAKRLKSDSSPWIVSRKDWQGLPLAKSSEVVQRDSSISISDDFSELDSEQWLLRDDTFPSNLALFRPSNFEITANNVAQLTLRQEHTSVRQFTSASIASRRPYLYGHFEAEVMPSNVAGLITGIFLHRNAPRQEIDLEILGKDTTKVLVNVYYNPGNDGAKMEYGYRGTPALIDLGFDATKEFHLYKIEWSPESIRWLVDGRLIHERVTWEPTPIPHLPMQFNINLWHSRSKELAGKLAVNNLPAHSFVRCIGLQSPA